MELLDIVDLHGNPTGETVERSAAHGSGIRHRTSHVWIYRIKDGAPQLLLQKRCREKDSFPGCYDISSAGHIPAGDSFETSALRELREELGVEASEDELIPCGIRSFAWNGTFHGRAFHDRQVSKVFLLKLQTYEEKDFTVQESEIESVCWMDFAQCVYAVEHHTIPHCIYMEELEMLKNGDPRFAIG